jgi:hypothetical protein
MIIDADELDVEHIYKLLIATIVPRAIGWVSSLSPAGVARTLRPSLSSLSSGASHPSCR